MAHAQEEKKGERRTESDTLLFDLADKSSTLNGCGHNAIDPQYCAYGNLRFTAVCEDVIDNARSASMPHLAQRIRSGHAPLCRRGRRGLIGLPEWTSEHFCWWLHRSSGSRRFMRRAARFTEGRVKRGRKGRGEEGGAAICPQPTASTDDTTGHCFILTTTVVELPGQLVCNERHPSQGPSTVNSAL